MLNHSTKIMRRNLFPLIFCMLAIVLAYSFTLGPSHAAKNSFGALANKTPAATQVTNGKTYFDSNRDGTAQIYSMNPDGSGQTRLTNDSGIDADPSFSDQNQKIAFTSRCCQRCKRRLRKDLYGAPGQSS